MSMRVVFALLVLAVILTASPTARADNYVSWPGGFWFSYPDDWELVDYQLVDAYLKNNRVDQDALNYDVVLSDTTHQRFVDGKYLMVTLDVRDRMDGVLDSILYSWRKEFVSGRYSLRGVPIAEFLPRPSLKIPYYDEEHSVLALANDIERGGVVIKRSIVVLKVYEKGIAQFFFYSPVEEYEELGQAALAMISSFSTENLDQAAPKEALEVADIPEPKPRPVVADEVEDTSSIPILWFAGPVIALIVVLVITRRRRRIK